MRKSPPVGKADRLFQLVTLLRGRRTATTAQTIAKQMGVSVRTVYRDIQALAASGVVVEGEAGVGYALQAQSHLPPLMFSAEEVLALMLGSRMVRAFTDPDLALAAHRAEQKIRAVLPEPLKQLAARQPYRIPVLQKDQDLRVRHGHIRIACEQQCKLAMHYSDEAGQLTQRTVWPLGMMGLHGRWMLLAWCETRQDYRTFRFDRIQTLHMLDAHFQTTPTRNLAHYFRHGLGIDDSDW